MITFKGRHTPKCIILQCVRWYCAYSLSYRNIEEMMAERGIKVDHSTLNRWVVYYASKLEKAFHQKKKQPGSRWRLDETYIKVKGEWRYYYRAVDKQGNTVDFLLAAKRDTKAAARFLNKSISRNGQPSMINIDKSGANKAGINRFNQENHRRVKIRQCKYLNNVVEQDHRRVKRITRSMLGFKSFHCAQSTLAGIELVAMLQKGQMKKNLAGALTPTDQFYALAA
ncbi:IS6 family transposase [uncultured Zhongshania sp.]|uniref:IS6 family transposase n=1 Tax=uncultured Zhongshania sp. TaxID=1642288 RepID=UPI0025D2B29C|nr:IS6 family transposase [uncultured Zhongshania sp.]